MKKFLCVVFVVCAFVLCGCNSADAISVSFSNITGAASTDNTVAVYFAEEKSYKEKYVDVLVLGEVDSLTIMIAKENQDFVTIVLPKKDVWYSINALVATANKEQGAETYPKYSDVSSQVYIIRSNVETTLKFKACTGTVEKNATGGQLLATRADASKVFELKLKKYEPK
ncbi:MAG: hypothetical protein IJA69_01835 [Clostridia bacterium]|nr:hypothetical protein [Clostridia bacterium]